jgi:hypothetical protein
LPTNSASIHNLNIFVSLGSREASSALALALGPNLDHDQHGNGKVVVRLAEARGVRLALRVWGWLSWFPCLLDEEGRRWEALFLVWLETERVCARAEVYARFRGGGKLIRAFRNNWPSSLDNNMLIGTFRFGCESQVPLEFNNKTQNTRSLLQAEADSGNMELERRQLGGNSQLTQH